MMAASCNIFPGKSWRASMQINGEWVLFSDGVERPVIRGEVLASDGSWVRVPFLVDTGPGRTVCPPCDLPPFVLGLSHGEGKSYHRQSQGESRCLPPMIPPYRWHT